MFEFEVIQELKANDEILEISMSCITRPIIGR